ncbi:hypothetical protein D3C79_673130 [compost metagenome]
MGGLGLQAVGLLAGPGLVFGRGRLEAVGRQRFGAALGLEQRGVGLDLVEGFAGVEHRGLDFLHATAAGSVQQLAGALDFRRPQAKVIQHPAQIQAIAVGAGVQGRVGFGKVVKARLAACSSAAGLGLHGRPVGRVLGIEAGLAAQLRQPGFTHFRIGAQGDGHGTGQRQRLCRA